MTAEERAKEIFKIYWEMFLFDNDISTEETWGKIAKKSALLCVEQIIAAIPSDYVYGNIGGDMYSITDYWKDVQHNLINL